MSSETVSFKSRLSRHAAGVFDMPQYCRNRNCRRAGGCRGTISSDGEPPCITDLKANDRKLFAFHLALAELGAEDIRNGKIRLVAKLPYEAHAQRMGLLIAALTFADLAADRTALRKRLRAMNLTSWRRRPPRAAAFFYCDFGRPAENTEQPDNDAASRP